MLMVSFQQSLHYDDEVFEDPHTFRHDRFLNADGTEKTKFYKNGKLLKQYVMPFGMGIRSVESRTMVLLFRANSKSAPFWRWHGCGKIFSSLWQG